MSMSMSNKKTIEEPNQEFKILKIFKKTKKRNLEHRNKNKHKYRKY